jgi:hypothetical protein
MPHGMSFCRRSTPYLTAHKNHTRRFPVAEEKKEMNIYQKLAEIRKQVEVMQKNKSGYGYRYVDEESILAKISVFMTKYGLSLIPGIVPGTTAVEPYHYVKTKTTKDGKTFEEHCNEVLVRADTTWTWVNNERPEERIVVPWGMVGQQSDASQSFGSGLTYSSRYFLLKYFNVATSDDDPDYFRAKQREAEEKEEKETTNAIVQKLDEAIRGFLESHSDRAADVKTLVSKYVKSGDYRKIKESKVAAKLYAEFKEMFLKEEK